MPSKTTRTRLLIAAAILAQPIVLAAFVIQHPGYIAGAKLFESVLLATQSQYVKPLPIDSLYVQAARGMVRELHDPFSELMSPQEVAQFSRMFSQEYQGIGTTVAKEPGGVVFAQVFAGAPAASAGILPGDKLVQIDSFDVRTWDEAKVREKLLGVGGTPVTLKVLRDGRPEPTTVVVTRGGVHVPAVPYTRLLEHQVGYIPLTIFRASAGDEVRQAAESLIRAGAKRLILDLRYNPGGMTDQAVAVSNLFLPNGKTILTERYRQNSRDYATSREPAFPAIPLVVLVNGASASSSEIVAGSLQDYDRALLVGTTTFGKGVGQTTIPVDDGYVLKLTVMEWVTPLGRSIHKTRTTELQPTAVPADSSNVVESDSSIRARPTFKTAAGRTVYGGGGIVPDVVLAVTRTKGDEQLMTEMRKAGTLFSAVVARYAASLHGKLAPKFAVTPAMRAEVVRRLRADGLALDDATLAGGQHTLDDMIASQIMFTLASDSLAPPRPLSADPQVQRAIALLAKADDQPAVFAAARTEPPVVPAASAPAASVAPHTTTAGRSPRHTRR